MTNREGERVHLLQRISVTAPVFHFDTSCLNTDACNNTASEEGATKKRKNNPHHKQQKGPVLNHKQTKNKKCEKYDQTNLELSCTFHITPHTTRDGAAALQRGEREREHLMAYIFVTAPVFQLNPSWLLQRRDLQLQY